MPSRYPSIAGHPDRDQIDALLDAGASLRSIALTHGISKTTLIRYRDSRQLQPDAPPVARVRTRPCSAPQPQDVTPSDPTEDAPCAPEEEECDHLSPTEARLRDVARLLAEGRSREEIAARYNVTAGTVTDWHRQIKENGTVLVRTVTAEKVVATLLANREQRSAALWRIANMTEITAPRTAIAALGGLRKEDQHVAALAETLGVFNRFPAQGQDERDDLDTLAADARELGRQISELVQDGTNVAELFRSGSFTPAFPSGPDQGSEVDHMDQSSGPPSIR